MSKRLISIELDDENRLHTRIVAGLTMERLGQILASAARAGVTAHRTANDIPEDHAPHLGNIVTHSFLKNIEAGAPAGSETVIHRG